MLTSPQSFKAYLARWMAQAAIVAPSIKANVTTLLSASAQAAAQACAGDVNGSVCGQKWYVGGYDGSFGVGQQLSALETVQSLLLLLGGNASTPASEPDQASTSAGPIVITTVVTTITIQPTPATR